MNDALLASLARPTFSPGFTEWLATAPMEEIEGAYAENYKDAHGIKARWVYDAGISREEFADMFVSLGADLKAEQEREEAEERAFHAFIASLGLTGWAKRLNIRDRYDVMDLQWREEYRPDPEPLPYEHLVPGRLALI